MYARYCILAFLTLVGYSRLAAQSPAGADTRLREALREANSQLKSAQGELASARADLATVQQERDEAQQKAAALQKQVTGEFAALEKSSKALKTQVEAQSAELERLKRELEEARSGLASAKTTETTLRQELEGAALQRGQLQGAVTDLKAKNLKLFFLSGEILKRYENHSLGKALAAKEPFIGQARTKLETLIQGYRDEIDANLAKH